MPVSMNDVRAVLDPDEPDYGRARELGMEALPFLAALIQAEDRLLAAKAVHLAALIGAADAKELLADAARSADPVVRLAAAGAARYLPAEAASEIVLTLVDDLDRGVQRIALKSAPTAASPLLRRRLKELRDSGPGPQVRDIAARAVAALEPPA